MAGEIVNVGIIGTGMSGQVHARKLARRTAGAEVVAVMDIDEARARLVAAECGASQTYTDAFALIDDPAVDAVLISSPDVSHAEQALACIRAGKPVLCEKPLATTRADAKRILDAEVAGGGRLLQVGFMREYDRAHRDLVALLRSGEIGAPLKFRGIHINPRRGFDVTIDNAIVNSLIHDIHSARFMMGVEITSVQVQWVAARPEAPQSARFAIILLGFETGAIGTLEWSGDSGYGYEVEVEIVGETGTARTVSNTSPILRQSGSAAQAITPNWPERFAAAYVDEMEAWIGSVLSGTPTGPSAWDGYMSLVVADACIRSTETGTLQQIDGGARPAPY